MRFMAMPRTGAAPRSDEREEGQSAEEEGAIRVEVCTRARAREVEVTLETANDCERMEKARCCCCWKTGLASTLAEAMVAVVAQRMAETRKTRDSILKVELVSRSFGQRKRCVVSIDQTIWEVTLRTSHDV